jgi:TIR domain
LRKKLGEVFGDESVFLDKDTLHAGNWRAQIHAALNQCRVVLVVIGRHWLTITDETGLRRLNHADDVHRQEIALALSRKEVTVIPVRVDGVAMPRAEDLPTDIRSLGEQQSRELSDTSGRRELDMQLLIRPLGFDTVVFRLLARDEVIAAQGSLGFCLILRSPGS